jgi:L-glutamine-phosphate cytidylyltransferase
MKALILAAGRGSRMGALTGDAPKCLTQLGGRSLLDWQISALQAAGIQDIGIVRGYLAEKLQRPKVYCFENSRWQSTNMVRSLETAKPWLKAATCVVSYSDIVYAPASVRALLEVPADISIAYDPNWYSLWARRFSDPLSDAETFRCDTSGFLTEIGAKTTDLKNISGQYMGLLKFTPKGWMEVEKHLSSMDSPAVDKLDMTSLLSALLKKHVSIRAVPIADGWYEVDSESDLRLYENEITLGKSWLRTP